MRDHLIRRAGALDQDAVARELAAYLAFIEEIVDADGLDRDIKRWQEIYDGRNGVMLVVIDPSGEVVGTAGVRLLEPGVGELKRMWVRPACQGRGFGRRLLDACLAEARLLGCQVLRLDSEKRMQAAVHLYRSYGFHDIADYNRNPRADVWMETRL